MKARQKIVAALEALSSRQDVRKVSLAEIARSSGVSWPTVRRHVGGPEGLAAFVESEGIAVPKQLESPGEDPVDVKMKILEAAFVVFSEKGYPGASIDVVAKEAGMTKGAVYWHFANKRDLFRELMLLRNAEGAAIGPSRIEDAEDQVGGIGASENPHEIFSRLMEQQIRLVEHERDWWWLTFENLTEARDEGMRSDLAAGLSTLLKANAALIDNQKANDRVSEEVDSEGFAVMWQAMLIGLGYLNLMDPGLLQDRDLGAKIAHSLWHGFDPSVTPKGDD